MTLVARIKELAQEQSLTLAELERKLNFPNSSIRKWDQQNPGINKIQKVADYFDVSTDYLLGRTDKRHYYDLTEKEKKDIAIQAEKLLEGLDSDAETNYYGEPLDDEDKEKLYDAIQLALSLTKVKAKKKFTPKKYRQ
ncbi:helix-turn-helix domain-containing protein [Megamonas sp.]|uniref:helix-turn-helix domain-containing protein n=1 Tax=Megamonas sp. TaxID=2049033 RepID=UPI00258695A3|nr:helix-turn-helix domain-containing protein [Megamonas sp.]